MNEIQGKLLDMMSFVHAVCQDNGIRYYALGGTMLGAVRHQGFVPWDDDIDIGMPRDDYVRFQNTISRMGNLTRYQLETPASSDPLYRSPYSKLYDTSTTLIENTRTRMVRGIYMDIFPLDGVSDHEEEVHRLYKRINRRLNVLTVRQMALSSDRKLYKNIIVAFAGLIPQSILSDKRLSVKVEKLCARASFDQCRYGGSLVGAWGEREIMDRTYYGKPTLYPFESMKICGVEKPDEYLTHLYGDWRTPPPPEARQTHHSRYFIDLNNSFEEYREDR